jgi:hypothetical protein
MEYVCSCISLVVWRHSEHAVWLTAQWSTGDWSMANAYVLATLLAGLFLTAFAGQAHASVVYDLTLTATSDTDKTPLSMYDGTGTITLSSAPSITGQSNYSSAAVTFTIDGESFSGTATGVQFLDGNFRNATFSEQIGSSPSRFDLQTTSLYAFYYDNELQEAAGAITSSLATTPLPATLPLFAGGLGFVGYLTRRKKREQSMAA